ncbi:MAG: AraC family transcriptional regulator [Tolypothrix carrinoi HA7290-LM1]|nr:AraC family transcriptional regulator [Tolypothrix carrinoi HA7290-LM1]
MTLSGCITSKDILIHNLNSPPSLLDLARQVGLNDRKLKEGFLLVFGTTVFGYLQTHRMLQGKQLLAERSLSVAGVAHAVGYTSPSRFCDAFKRQFGITPKAYQIRLHS